MSERQDATTKLRGVAAEATAAGLAGSVITGHSFAQYWIEDARREAEGDSWHHVRREIIFSAAFLEAYLFEWAQSLLVQHADADALVGRFPQGKDLDTLRKKWTKLVPEVFEKFGLGEPPEISHSEFERLLQLRNDLLHAQSSRLRVSAESEKSTPVPSAEDLMKIQNGWALDVALQLVERLHAAVGSTPPAYLKS